VLVFALKACPGFSNRRLSPSSPLMAFVDNAPFMISPCPLCLSECGVTFSGIDDLNDSAHYGGHAARTIPIETLKRVSADGFFGRVSV